jgi:hypothetical protein
VYIAITTKGYPSRYIYSSADGNTRGVLGGACGPMREQQQEGSASPLERRPLPTHAPRLPRPPPHHHLHLAALKKEVLERFADMSTTCPPNGLDSKCKPLLKVGGVGTRLRPWWWAPIPTPPLSRARIHTRTGLLSLSL